MEDLVPAEGQGVRSEGLGLKLEGFRVNGRSGSELNCGVLYHPTGVPRL